MCVGFLAVVAFIVGALCGVVVLAMLWAASARTSVAIFVAVVSCMVLICVCPFLWYCYCSKASRRAAQSAAGGFLTADYEWCVELIMLLESLSCYDYITCEIE